MIDQPFDEPPVLLDTSDRLPAAYTNQRRVPGDPLGKHGLPSDRVGLDEMLVDLCRRLISAGHLGVRGRQLAEEMHLQNTRSLRLLVAYGHVHHRLRQIVGVNGKGYVWGPFQPTVYLTMALHAKKMGRDFFFNSTLYGKSAPQVQAAQLLLDFVGTDQPGPPDELSVLMSSHNVTIEQVINSLVDLVKDTDKGRQVLRRVGDRHASVLLPAEKVAALRQRVEALHRDVEDLLGTTDRAGVKETLTPGSTECKDAQNGP
jgi:hypothetical protein